jgi:very-short-patch-repair endonuclease
MRDASTGRRKGAVSQKELRQAIRQAGVLGLRIDAERKPDRTRSELEHLFLRLCQRHGLPIPQVNVRIDSFLVDFLWRDRRLIVETDGYQYHSGRAAFEADRDRDLKLKACGYEVIRLSYRQVVEEPERVAESLSGLLDVR